MQMEINALILKILQCIITRPSGASAGMNVIDVRNIRKQFKTYESRGTAGILPFGRRWYYKKALNGVNFSIKKGEIVALLGKNGSGKSTLVKTMCGILHPDSGKARVLGFDPWKNRIDMVRNMGVVLGAHGQLMWNLPALDTFELMRHIYKIPQEDFRKRLDYFLGILDLEEVYRRQVRTLSLGEQMKCNFVASVLHSPELVILDEPTIGVDLPSKQALKEMIVTMNKKNGTTFMLTTHIVEDLTMAGRILVLDRGRVIFDGSRRRLETFFGNKRVLHIKFIGKPNYSSYAKYGKITEIKNDYLRMLVNQSVLTKNDFTEMLSKKNVLDYDVSEQGLSTILMKLYGSAEKKKKV